MNLNVISVNIRFNNPQDGVNAWPHRKSYLSEILLKHSPDLIATQEGRFDQLKELEELLVDFELVAPHRTWLPHRMYPSFFLRKNTFEVIHSFDKWLSLTPDVSESKSFESAFPRLLTAMTLKPKNSEHELLVVNTHFDHIKSSTRVGQSQVLCQEINKVYRPEQKLLLLGDYNDSPDSLARQHISASFPDLYDCWAKFNAVEVTSHHGFNSEINAGSRIDWILVDKRIDTLESFLDKSHQGEIYPSDHYPVIAKLKL